MGTSLIRLVRRLKASDCLVFALKLQALYTYRRILWARFCSCLETSHRFGLPAQGWVMTGVNRPPDPLPGNNARWAWITAMFTLMFY